MFEHLNLIQKLVVWALPVLFALTMHQVAQGYMAYRLGDTSAKAQGRLSLNPLRHIDLIGTLLVPAVLIALDSGFLFGWAKPIPISVRQLSQPRRDLALIGLVGVGAQLAMALFWGILLKIGIAVMPDASWVGQPLYYMGMAGIVINIVLTAINLLPIPPLDGSRMLAWLLPPRAAYWMDRIEPYGLYILLALLFTRTLELLLGPVVYLLQSLLFSLLGFH